MRRVAPLTRCVLPLYAMASGALFDETTLAEGVLSPFEVVQHIKEVMEPSWDSVDAPLILCTRCRGTPRCSRN